MTEEPLILGDGLLRARLEPASAVAWMRQAVLDAERGVLISPPRVVAPLGPGQLVFTAGAQPGRWFGYRSYDTLGAGTGEQVVVLHDGPTGQVRALAIGRELGPRRTGALGAVAVDVLARRDASRLALIGTGPQAFAQVWAIAAVRTLTAVQVWSRDPSRRARFVQLVGKELALPVAAAASAEQAVTSSDIVVVATDSAVPVLAPGWLAPGTHVNTLGPKQQGRSELDLGVAERADLLVTDSPRQVADLDPAFLLAGTPHLGRLVSLGSVVAKPGTARRSREQVSLFYSVGLAGTEVHLLAELAALVSSRKPPPGSPELR